MLCLAAIGFLHRSLDEAHSTLLRRWVRLCVRILCAIFFITFPLVPNGNATFDIGVNTGFLALVVVAETVGKISLRGPLDDSPESGASSKEARALAAGFRIEDLTPCEKYVDPAACSDSRRLLTACGIGVKLRLITLGPSGSSALSRSRKTIARRLQLQYRAYTHEFTSTFLQTDNPRQRRPRYTFHHGVFIPRVSPAHLL